MAIRKNSFINDQQRTFIVIKGKGRDNKFLPYVHLLKNEDWKPIKDSLVKYESSVIDDLNTLFTKSREIHFQLNKEVYSFCFVPSNYNLSPELSVTIQSDDNFIWLGLEKQTIIDLFDGDNTSELPKDIKCALFESILEPLLDQFDKWAGVKTNICDVDAKGSPKNYGYNLFFRITRRRDRYHTMGQMSLTQSGVNWLAGLLKTVSEKNTNDAGALAVNASIVVGSTNLTLGEMKTLEENDIILFEKSAFYPDEKRCQVRFSDRLSWEGVLENSIITIDKFEGGTMTESVPENKNSEEEIAANIDELAVEVVFELGRKEIAIRELKNITSGYTFDLDKKLSHPVDLRANGKIIGEGELVRIDDRVGVKIISINL